jgi:hypothetical protein
VPPFSLVVFFLSPEGARCKSEGQRPNGTS